MCYELLYVVSNMCEWQELADSRLFCDIGSEINN